LLVGLVAEQLVVVVAQLGVYYQLTHFQLHQPLLIPLLLAAAVQLLSTVAIPFSLHLLL
jgi:hypothetical protein